MANLDLGNPESSKQKASSSIRKGFDDFIFLALDHISKKESTDRAIAYKALQNEVKNAKSFSDPAQFEELEGKLMKAHADYGHDKTTQAGLDLLDDALQRTEDTFTLNTELRTMHKNTEVLLANSKISLKEKTDAALDLLETTNLALENSQGEMHKSNFNQTVKSLNRLSKMHELGSLTMQADKRYGATTIDKDEESPTFGQLISTPEMDVPLEVFDDMVTALQFGDLGAAGRKSAKIDSYKELIEKNNVIGPVEEDYNVLKDNIYYTGNDLAKSYLVRMGVDFPKELKSKQRSVYNALQMSTGTGTAKVELTRTSIPQEIKKIESQVNNFLDPSLDIVKEIKNVDADNAYRKKGFKGMVGHLSEKAQIPLADGGFDKTWKELSIFEKRELIGDTIDFTNTIDIPGYGIDYFREEGAETDFLKDFIIQYVDSVDMLTTLRATLIAGQNNPSIYREHIE